MLYYRVACATANCYLHFQTSHTLRKNNDSNCKNVFSFTILKIFSFSYLLFQKEIMSQPPTDHEKVSETKQPTSSTDSTQPATLSSDYAPYPKLDPKDVAPPPENWTTVSMASQSDPSPDPVPISSSAATTMPAESNPYVSPAPVQSFSVKNKMESVKDVLGKWGKKAADDTKKAKEIAENMWQHLKTGPSFADAAVGRIAQTTKVIADGGYEKIFRTTFETVPEEQLLKTYACYLSTSAGPVIGVLYLSTHKLGFCSDSPLAYQVGDQTQYSYYKLVIPLHQLRAVNPSASKANPAEKYIQITSVDNHEFWFMGFVHYDSAVKNLQGALQSRGS